MKILFLAKDPRECARKHSDEEAIENLRRYTKLLSQVYYKNKKLRYEWEHIQLLDFPRRGKDLNHAFLKPYKKTNNHTEWVNLSFQNWYWLWAVTTELFIRYHKIKKVYHPYDRIIFWFSRNWPKYEWFKESNDKPTKAPKKLTLKN